MTQLRPLEWQPMDKPGDLYAKHVDGGTYCIQYASWRGQSGLQQLSYRMDVIGEHASVAEAQAAAEEHQARTHRANLWTRYMADNDPPIDTPH